MVKILVIGGGGREHAICWKLCQSDRVSQVYVAPGSQAIRLDKPELVELVDLKGFQVCGRSPITYILQVIHIL